MMRSLPVSPGGPIAAPWSSQGLNHLENWRRRDFFRQLLLAAGRRDLGCEIGFLLFDSLAESIAHKSGNLYRCTDLALSFLDRLGDRFALFVVDKCLLQQAGFLI